MSTDGQSVDAGLRQLRPAGVRQVFREVASGAKSDRSQFRRSLARFVAKDVPTRQGGNGTAEYNELYSVPPLMVRVRLRRELP